jgi:hypothetical protein
VKPQEFPVAPIYWHMPVSIFEDDGCHEDFQQDRGYDGSKGLHLEYLVRHVLIQYLEIYEWSPATDFLCYDKIAEIEPMSYLVLARGFYSVIKQ